MNSERSLSNYAFSNLKTGDKSFDEYFSIIVVEVIDFSLDVDTITHLFSHDVELPYFLLRLIMNL